MTRLCALCAAVLGLLATGCAVYELGSRYTSAFDAHDRSAAWDLPSDFYIATEQENRIEFWGPYPVPLVPLWLKPFADEKFTLTGQLEVLDGRDFSLAWRPCLELDGGDTLCAESAIAGWIARNKERHPAPYHRFDEYLPNQPWMRSFAEGESAERLTRASIDERVGYRGTPVPRLGVTVE